MDLRGEAAGRGRDPASGRGRGEHGVPPSPRKTARETQEEFRQLPPIDVEQWYRDREAADRIFGDDRLEY